MKYKLEIVLKSLVMLIIALVASGVVSCTNQHNIDFIDVRNLENSYQTVVVKGQGYFPVILAVPTDEALVVLRGGAPHIGVGGRLDLVRSEDAGATWSEPSVIVDSDKDDRNPAFGRASDGTLVMAYHWQAGYDDDGKWSPGPYKQDTKFTLSHDNGVTWEEPEFLNIELQRGNSPFGKIFKDDDGVLYMPIYGAKNPEPGVRISFDTTYTFLVTSKDNGKSWSDIIEVAKGLNEADYLILPNKEWLCAARSQKRDEQAIYLCRSADQGKTWSEPIRITEAKEHPPDLTMLSDGTLLLIFGVRHEPFSIQGMVSRDLGHTWLNTRLLLADNLPGTDIGYPSTVRLSNGRIITVYYRAGKKADQDKNERACVSICYDERILLNALKQVD
jgi:Neuraminidase (sialidase)